MRVRTKRRLPTVAVRGAPAGAVLLGCGPANRGLLVRVSEPQERGWDGPVRGPVTVLSPGDGPDAAAFTPFVGRQADAAQLLAAARRWAGGAVTPVNTGLLIVEPPAVTALRILPGDPWPTAASESEKGSRSRHARDE